MAQANDRYLDAAKQDYDRLKGEVQSLKQSITNPDGPDSQLLDTAWADLEDQWQRLQAVGETASEEVQQSFDQGRERLRRVIDSYRQG
ncbi:hypothetical protein EV659_10522 [Rhodothalassium salexigens DSM 2132]|uniref:Uncharacterized protein n=1 Tax=Rhodothalassium salexigens DSM 2132 TaxID=1188247 RepID=A0A4R2PGQ5_RHOSA|nr:hypothetical protein [Rhodothalassium salexigens]MBB4211671.1 hypothetical protein [Rhodothalassium salexigens DSM 2132]TCP34397.1 hypothetical protein EV659_10522 [Rhodothalassium salexigens DSM 2132]